MTIRIRWVGSEPKTYTAKELELAYKFTDQKRNATRQIRDGDQGLSIRPGLRVNRSLYLALSLG